MFISLVLINTVSAEELQVTAYIIATLTVKPAHCVVFREGQFCAKEIKVEWQTSEVGAYCIYDKSPKPLKCWKQGAQGEYVIDKKVTESTSYSLRQDSSNKTLATGDVTIVWVYEEHRKNRSSWRLF